MISGVLAFSQTLLAQQPEKMGDEFRIRKVDINEIQNPTAGNPSRPNVTSIERNWIEILIEYEARPIHESKVSALQYVPEVQFNFLMGLDDVSKDKGKEWYDSYSFLSGEVIALNVYDGSPHYAAIYIHPNVVKRFGGSSAFRSSQKAFALVEIVVDGKVKDIFSTDKKLLDNMEWRTAISTTPGMMVNKNKTPWATSWWNTFEMIKD